MPTASRRAISGGTSCIVEQLGFAMMPSCHARSSGLTCEHDERDVRVHPPRARVVDDDRRRGFAASGASSFDVPPPALNSAMSTPSNASGVASPTVEVPPADLDRAARGPLGREQPQLRDREALLEQDLGHRPADGAGGADDGDGQRIRGGFSGMVRPFADGLSGTGGVYQRAPAGPAAGEWSPIRRLAAGQARRRAARRAPARGPAHDLAGRCRRRPATPATGSGPGAT